MTFWAFLRRRECKNCKKEIRDLDSRICEESVFTSPGILAIILLSLSYTAIPQKRAVQPKIPHSKLKKGEMPLIGRRIKNRYYLLERLGEGGEGTVYLARDEELGKYWAVKRLPPDRREEVQVLRKLSHSMLPQIVDYVQEEGCAYLVMEYIQGKTLEELRRKKPCSKKQVILWGIQLCQVLEYLHTRYPAVIHMDVKPSNILVTEQGELYLIDLGSCALSDGQSCRRRERRGTAGYAAPEQRRGEADCTCDIYGLGKTMEILVGGRMRAGRELGRIIKKCQRPQKERRYQSCRELGRELGRLNERKRHHFWIVLLGLLGGILAGRTLVVQTVREENVQPEEVNVQEDFLDRYTKIQDQIHKGMLMEEGQARRLVFRQSEIELGELLNTAEDIREEIWLRLSLARVCREQKREKDASENYEWLIERGWEKERISSEYGMYLLERGKRKESQELYDRVCTDSGRYEGDLFKRWEEALDEK